MLTSRQRTEVPWPTAQDFLSSEAAPPARAVVFKSTANYGSRVLGSVPDPGFSQACTPGRPPEPCPVRQAVRLRSPWPLPEAVLVRSRAGCAISLSQQKHQLTGSAALCSMQRRLSLPANADTPLQQPSDPQLGLRASAQERL